LGVLVYKVSHPDDIFLKCLTFNKDIKINGNKKIPTFYGGDFSLTKTIIN
jgi:hypothetical protein